MKRMKMDVTKLMDGTAYGRLKVSVFVYLNRKFPEKPPEDLEALDNEIMGLFRMSEVNGMTRQWYKMAFTIIK